MRPFFSRYLMALLCMLAAGTWVLPVHALTAPAPMPMAHDGGDGGVAVEETAAIAVESVTDEVLLPKQVVPSEPAPGIEVVFLIASQAVPEECLALLGLTTPVDAGAASGTVGVGIELHSVAVAFVRKGESAMRFGFGLRSDVLVTAQSQFSGTSTRAESFQLVSESPNLGDAVDGSTQLWNQLSQVAPAPAPQFPYYSTCVQLCLTDAHNQWWQTVVDCLAMTGTAAGLLSGAAALACLLSGPAWKACVLGLLTGIGLLAAVAVASCLASYLAAMAVAIPTCTVGCAL